MSVYISDWCDFAIPIGMKLEIHDVAKRSLWSRAFNLSHTAEMEVKPLPFNAVFWSALHEAEVMAGKPS